MFYGYDDNKRGYASVATVPVSSATILKSDDGPLGFLFSRVG